MRMVAAFPWEVMLPSFRVDMLGMIAAGKPAVRAVLPSAPSDQARLREAAAEFGIADESDGSYVVLAREEPRAREVLAVDRCAEPHEFELGLLLGYPYCCAKYAAEVGEQHLDSPALSGGREGSADERETGRLIDVSRYRDGIALISHIPCSSGCEPSQLLAAASAQYVRATASDEESTWKREPWKTWRVAASLAGALTSPDPAS